MEEVKQDVETESSPVIETPETPEVVNTEVEATPSPETQEVVPSAPEVKEESPKDNRPIENVAWESKRKVDELYSVVNEMKEMLQRGQGQQQQQPSYSKAQLLTYAQSPEITTEQRLWAYGEVDKLEKDERKKEYESLVTQTREKTESENRRMQSSNWVAQSFPDTVVKDQMGNPVGWNQGHPLLMKANEYMNRSKSLREDPEGFAAAVKLAAFDLGVNMNKKTTQKLDRTIGQLRKEQKKQLASTGGTRIAETPENVRASKYKKLQDTYAKTGDRDVFNELLKMRGMNPFAK